jgi:hypothetical protein
MRIPRHWAKGSYTGRDRAGNPRTFQAWGWSSSSLEAARSAGEAAARRIFDRLQRDEERGAGPYDYLDRPLREEIVESVAHEGAVLAAITRNHYGALVLNTSSVCFADVDFPRAVPNGILDALVLAFSAARREQRRRLAEEATIEHVRGWLRRHPGRALRLYRTCAGLRLLFTDRLYEPASQGIAQLFSELGTDALYRRLTEKQECFRARLTPKPWRCGCPRPPRGYPWNDPAAEQAYREWQRDYEDRSRSFRVCRLLERLGTGPADERIAAVMELHDRHTCGADGAPLA